MKFSLLLGVMGAIALHGGFLLFGGLLLPESAKSKGSAQVVELLSEVDAEKPKTEPERKEPEPEPIEAQKDQPPDPLDVARALDPAPLDDAPALDAASLSALEAALESGGGAGGEFGDALSLASGGRLGGTGKALDGGDPLESALSLAEIDQKPRAMFQAAPLYPSELRSKKLEGVVTLIFVVDASGKVAQPRVEKSSHPAFEKPALDALKQWKFEPGLKGGQRVGCKMRVPIRFQPS